MGELAEPHVAEPLCAPGATPARVKGQGNERLGETFKETPCSRLTHLKSGPSLWVESSKSISQGFSSVLSQILPSPQAQSTPSIPGI